MSEPKRVEIIIDANEEGFEALNTQNSLVKQLKKDVKSLTRERDFWCKEYEGATRSLDAFIKNTAEERRMREVRMEMVRNLEDKITELQKKLLEKDNECGLLRMDICAAVKASVHLEQQAKYGIRLELPEAHIIRPERRAELLKFPREWRKRAREVEHQDQFGSPDLYCNTWGCESGCPHLPEDA